MCLTLRFLDHLFMRKTSFPIKSKKKKTTGSKWHIIVGHRQYPAKSFILKHALQCN